MNAPLAPATVSPYVAHAAESTLTETMARHRKADATVAALSDLMAHGYTVWCEPKVGGLYRPEAETIDTRTRPRVLDFIKQHEDAAYVFQGARHVSEDFAHIWAREDGMEWLGLGVMPAFADRHLTWDDVEREVRS